MARLSGFALSILAILTLPLTAASNVGADPHDTANVKTERREHNQSSKQIAPSQQQNPTKESPANTPGNTYNYHGSFNYGPNYSAPPESRWAIAGDIATVISAFFITVFTGLLILVNWKLVGVTDEMKKATAEAAQAAKQSAKAAELALYLNRPFLLVIGIVLQPPQRPDGRIHKITVVVENFGTGPADVRDYTAEAALLDWPKAGPFADVWGTNDPPAWHPPDEGYRLEDPLIRANEKTRLPAAVELSIDQRKEIVDTEKKLRVEGRIRYRGSAPQTLYVTTFYWWFIPTNNTGQEGTWVRSFNEKYNTYT